MKTKNLLAAVVLILCSSQISKAQLSARLDIGYGFPSGSQTLQSSDKNGTYTVSPYSLGSGLNIALAGNYMFSDHIGAGLDLNMLMASPVTYTDGNSGSLTYTHTSTGSLFAITPNLILSAHRDKINPYGRFGIVLGIASITDKSTASGSLAPTGTNIDVYSGNLAIGWYAAFGLQFPISDNLKLNVELFDRDLTYAPSSYTNTQAYDGAQKANSQTLGTSINSNSSANSSLTSYNPFGSAGIKVGVELSLGK